MKTYLYERWEADRWADVSETIESDPYKGMLNANDYNAMGFAFKAETEAQQVANQGHPMMSYYTQPSNRSKFGWLLGINGYTAPGMPDFNLDLNLDKSKPAVKKPPRDPYENPYKNHGFGYNSVRNQPQSSEPVNDLSSIHAELRRAGGEIKQGIRETRANLKEKPSKVWDLDNVINITKADLKLTKGTLASKLIDDRIKQAQNFKLFKDIFLSIVSIGLGILAVSGIGTPLAILCGLGSLGISTYQFGVHYEEHNFLNSAAKTGFTPETALSSVQPDDMWMVLDLIGIGLDVIAAVKIIGQLGKLPSLFKMGGEGADVLTKPQLLEQFEKEVHSIVKNTDEANQIITEFTKKLDDPKHVEAIRNTDFSKTHLKNADEITETQKVKPKENGKFEESSLNVSRTEDVVVIINGRQFIKKSFGKNNTEVFIDADATDVYYYMNNDFNVPYAQFNLEGRVFTPGLEVPNSLRGQGIGKSTFNDAFERLGGSDKIDRIQSDWAGSSSVSDNFDSFKKALLENKSPKEAAFETATGKWAKELGYTNVELDPVDVQNIINGIKKTIQPTFTK